MHKRADYSRRLPRSLVIPTVMTLKTLADVRTLIGHLPEDRPARSAVIAWHGLAEQKIRATVRLIGGPVYTAHQIARLH